MKSKTDPSTEKALSEKGNRMCRKSGTILDDAKYQRVRKDWRKHYVVFHQWNQGKCMNTSRERCWFSTEESKTQNT